MEDFYSSPRQSSPLESGVYSTQESNNHHHHHYRHRHHRQARGAYNRKESEGGRPQAAARSRTTRRRSPQRFKVLPGQVAFRLFCHQSVIGGVIGNCGAIVSKLRRETDTKIHCENPAPGSDYGVVLVIGSGSPDRRIVLTDTGEYCDVSCAQEAMVRVFERIWTLEAQNEGSTAASGVVSARLLAEGSQNRVVMGKGGTNIIRMRKESCADITILPASQAAAGGDEVILIGGSVLAVKKALIAVSSYLQEHSPLDNGPTSLSRLSESSSSGASHVSDPHAEIFPNLSSSLPRTSSNSNASDDSSMTNADGFSRKDTKGKWQEVVFRLVCSNETAGSVIGRKGSIVRSLENETGAAIRFESPTGFGDRVVTISALENLESLVSPAQNAVLLVFARAVEGDIEKGFLSGSSNGETVITKARLLVASDVVGCLSGNEGKVISEVREVSGADIQILGGGPGNQVVQVIGEYKTVRDALFQVTRTLRDHLLPREFLNEVRPRSSFGRVTEDMSSRPQQSLSLFPDANDEALLTSQLNRLELSHSRGAFEPRSQLPQTLETGLAKAVTDGGEVFTKFGGDLDIVGENKLAVVTNTIVEIVVSGRAFGSIYGEDGDNLNRLKEISGAKVEVRDPQPGESEGKVVISGTPDQTLAAQSLLQAFIQTAKKT